MATRSNLTAKLSNGKWASVYVHHDGYPSHMFAVLSSSWTTQEKVDVLMSLGDMSSVSSSLESCEAYHRDRDEDWIDTCPTIGDSLEDARSFHLHGDEAYLYVWDGADWSYSKA